MSTVATVKSEIKDLDLLARICQEQNVECLLGPCRVRFFSSTVEGVAQFKLPHWQYPVVVGQDGKLSYDNHNGAWGKTEDLHQFTQTYSINKVIEIRQAEGYRVKDRITNAQGVVELLLEKL